MRLRPAENSDYEFLFRLRNDPETRANSNNHKLISKSEHGFWLAATLCNKQRKLYIAEVDLVPVGSCRADFDGDECELSWTVAPEYRHQGYGEQMVKLLKERSEMKFRCYILPHNEASIKIADRVGIPYATTGF